MTGNPQAAAPPGSRGVLVSAHPAATEAGRRMFAAGGNAVDAAVAAAWALCVCEPSGSGLGGQTVLLLHAADRTIAIDGHSRAPALVSAQTVTRPQQRAGHRATTVPTTPATLAYAQRHYGALAAADVLEPAIALAQDGYVPSMLQRRQLQWCRAALAATPAAARFLEPDRADGPEGPFVQPRLAECLRRLARCGVEDFYTGQVARAIDADMRRNGGLLRLSDLADLRSPVERQPLRGCYRNHAVLTMPAPGGGPQLLHALATLQNDDPAFWQGRSDEWYLAVARAVDGAFRQRERTHRHAAGTPADAPPLIHAAGGERAGETTHLCSADAGGTVVSLTQSIQSLFGAKVANPDYGFLYNNYLTTFPRRSHAHRLAGGGSARSNAAPTLVLPAQTGAPALALGAAGSRRIISSLVQVVSGVCDLGLPLPDAVSGPRVHPRVRGTVMVERPAASPSLLAGLSRRHGRATVRSRHSYTMGAVQALEISDSGAVVAAADPRRDGAEGRW
jgi:gamma-glutamyltranspeptidase/glutathione hydrolase